MMAVSREKLQAGLLKGSGLGRDGKVGVGCAAWGMWESCGCLAGGVKVCTGFCDAWSAKSKGAVGQWMGPKWQAWLN